MNNPTADAYLGVWARALVPCSSRDVSIELASDAAVSEADDDWNVPLSVVALDQDGTIAAVSSTSVRVFRAGGSHAAERTAVGWREAMVSKLSSEPTDLVTFELALNPVIPTNAWHALLAELFSTGSWPSGIGSLGETLPALWRNATDVGWCMRLVDVLDKPTRIRVAASLIDAFRVTLSVVDAEADALLDRLKRGPPFDADVQRAAGHLAGSIEKRTAGPVRALRTALFAAHEGAAGVAIDNLLSNLKKKELAVHTRALTDVVRRELPDISLAEVEAYLAGIRGFQATRQIRLPSFDFSWACKSLQ